jgi:hypothetical protein
MNRVIGAEMQRLLGGGGGSQSPEVAKYLDGPSLKRVELGDIRISLHVRFIERQRRNVVAGIALAETATAANCANPRPRTGSTSLAHPSTTSCDVNYSLFV